MIANLLLGIYRNVTTVAGPFTPALLDWRRRRGKEDPARLRERMGVASLPRPAGRLAWLHGASVGESLAMMPLIERLIARGVQVLLTTGTVTSATILQSRLPKGAVHQFVPVDVPKYIERFLRHWRPNIVLVAESELWPNLICQVNAKGIPLVLVNARLSARSFERWQRLPWFIGSLLSKIDLCLAQSRDDATRLLRLGAPRVQIAGNLKYDAPAPPVDAKSFAELTGMIGARPVWIAASTHEGEEEIAAGVHRRLAVRFPHLLTIIAPRHPRRAAAIAQMLDNQGLSYALRSAGTRIALRTSVYVADTMGEMGLFYRLGSVVFVGKSLAGHGGQNPIEPAKLGSAVLHGPHVGNFRDVYEMLDEAHGALAVPDADSLARALELLLSDVSLLRKMARLSGEAVAELGGATSHIMTALEPYFLYMQMERT